MTDKPASVLADYLTRDELAAELGVTTTTLWNWHVRGIAPPATKFGRHVLYARSSVAAWLTSREERRATARGKREGVTA